MISLVSAACLTLNVYFEAGNQSVEGMRLVAEVVINRVNHYNWPNDGCGVVFDHRQFSWANGLEAKTYRPKLDNEIEERAYNQASEVAVDVLENGCKICNNATHYHHFSIRPYWAVGRVKIGRIGDHIFYK